MLGLINRYVSFTIEDEVLQTKQVNEINPCAGRRVSF